MIYLGYDLNGTNCLGYERKVARQDQCIGSLIYLRCIYHG